VFAIIFAIFLILVVGLIYMTVRFTIRRDRELRAAYKAQREAKGPQSEV